ncbi:anti-sigma factor domain-containing protein [Leifsonia sp. Root60]|uniref:anti-sigma factor domain-containing protein n=2 Tax=unclassified Leifsonia TaxID=2663824 RepID=UPI0006F7E082|nr:anti-sigma factor [Leifsonia sp. Root60]KQX05359.1 hypothetical protein ASC59_14520 [Leifsonia sp. Root1293]KRA08991.1 hypothetical protein ASD61_14515 [Leifsonia sp. Root60]
MHLDDDTLALIALGDADPDGAQRSHLDSCERCSSELDGLRRTVSIGRSSRDVELLTPPQRVWDAISAELGLGHADARAEADTVETPDAAPPAPASITERRTRPTGFARWWPVAAAALVVGVLAGVAGAILWPMPSADVIAQAELDPFPSWNASGTARLEQSGSADSRDLVIDLDAPSGTDLREVWLIDPATNGLVSLGQLSGASGRFVVPAGIDLAQFSVVDISDEPADGNPAHSGDSIVRGQLRQL